MLILFGHHYTHSSNDHFFFSRAPTDELTQRMVEGTGWPTTWMHQPIITCTPGFDSCQLERWKKTFIIFLSYFQSKWVNISNMESLSILSRWLTEAGDRGGVDLKINCMLFESILFIITASLILSYICSFIRFTHQTYLMGVIAPLSLFICWRTKPQHLSKWSYLEIGSLQM